MDAIIGDTPITKKIPNRSLVIHDNLPVLAAMPDACVDLIYLDPPFNSKRQYSNVLNIPAAYAESLYQDRHSMGNTTVVAEFSDTWSMDALVPADPTNVKLRGRRRGRQTAESVETVAMKPNPNWKPIWLTAIAITYPELHAVLTSAGQAQDSQLQGYLTFMSVRLLEMRRVLKDTGSVYLHCDPTASHYLKSVMDCIFGHANFQNEFIWYYGGGGASKRRWARKHDVLLFYSNGRKWTFNADEVRVPHKWVDGQLRADGSERSVSAGKLPDDVYALHSVMPWAAERTGYPTQKPLALLDRIIKASSNAGDVVLDPFCGCATACVSAEKLGRRWIGIDVGQEAYNQVVRRMQETMQIGSPETPLLVKPEEHITRFGSDFPGISPDYRIAPRRVKGRGQRATEPSRREPIPDPIKRELYGIQEGRCAGCGHPLPYHILTNDHITPRARGGTEEIGNLQLLCGSCNPKKGDSRTTQALWEINIAEGILIDPTWVKNLWQRRFGKPL